MKGTYAYGVDVGGAQIAVAAIHTTTGQPWVDTYPWKPGKTETDCVNAYAAARDLVRTVYQDRPPVVVAVERPTGYRDRTPEVLTMVTGAVLAALSTTFTPAPWLISVGEWKRRSVGHGNASKDQVKAWAVDQFDYTGCTQDEADALGIAWAARAVLLEALAPEAA